jgi:glycyl-tRNA synthetase
VSKKLTFQELILRLERFWADQGCIVWQPYSEKVGAGTMNPATVLRVLGPRNWNVAYVEPSFRPDDGRFGENPNRMQMHTQYQVILKPDPGNPQERYLDSLEALGLDRKEHDIRFVEDNWESPALGAWGLGWEVWLDGMEITQFTYFQQAGGMALDPVAVEITYGLERIAMYLQEVDEVWKLQWNDDVTYGEILKLQEVDYCHYAFSYANVKRLHEMYALYAAEAKSALDRDLIVPAHDYILRCSHTFNLLDTRGAIGVTERARYFGEMRDMARQVAEGFLKQQNVDPESITITKDERKRPENIPDTKAETADFVLELGSEELPAQDVPSGIRQLEEQLTKTLSDSRLIHQGIVVSGTPRRLYACVKGLAGKQPDEEKWVRGPAAKAAFDGDGNPTKALEGFCRGQGVSPDDAERREDEKGVEYVYVHKQELGTGAIDVLANALPDLIASLTFPKLMRWDSGGIAYARPLRWIVALFGDQVIPFSYARTESGRTTRGLRPDKSPETEISTASEYLATLDQLGIVGDRDSRRQKIVEQVKKLAEDAGGRVPEDEGLLEEVTDLVESPHALRGTFDEAHLELPPEVLITVMRKHQRYFPIVHPETGDLLPTFITVSNGKPSSEETVVRGNEGVIRARYADATFFYKADTQHKLEDFLPKLHTLTFQEDLGSVLDKVGRIEKLLSSIAPELGLTDAETQVARRAARLCKADLATNMVVEMTSLQGVIGRYYAIASGESPEVAQAIEDHYHPRYPGDTPPESRVGFAISVADRLDSLAGLFCAGIRPRSTSDPFGLRRDAIGLLTCLIHQGQPFSLRKGLTQAADTLPLKVDAEKVSDACEFVLRRLEIQLKDEGFRPDVVTAVIEEGGDDPAEIRKTVDTLNRAVGAEDWANTFNAYSRCKRIVRDLDALPLSASEDSEPATAALLKAYEDSQATMITPTQKASAETLVRELLNLKAPINRFFDDVLVMAEDPKLKNARLSLLQHIANLPVGIADLSRLEGF